MRNDGMAPAAIAITPEGADTLLTSYLSGDALHDDDAVDEWIMSARATASMSTMLVPLDAIQGWRTETECGNIVHESGRFFTVMGIHCRHRVDRVELEWDQPIIEQPETGILGILAKPIRGILHFCLQAKAEPGNIGSVQLSPTVQATYSNYTGAHGGGVPHFLEHFISPDASRVIFSRMQTEDGGRFLYKSNRNMIVAVGEDFPDELPDGFIWLTLRQISRLIRIGDLVNACSRSILSGILSSAFTEQGVRNSSKGFHAGCEDIRCTLQWFDDRRAAHHIQAHPIGLNKLQEWAIDGKGFFSHKDKRFFRVVGLKVSSGAREVTEWGQPIIENQATGIIGLLLRNGTRGIELLMQAKAEVGNRNTVQLGPTVQFTQVNYEGSRKLSKPFLYDEFLEPSAFLKIHESTQTEEGARFYREHHLHRILMLPDGASLAPPRDYCWIPLNHVMFMLHLGEQVNSCARSILSCLP